MPVLKGADPELSLQETPRASAKPRGLNRGKCAENNEFQDKVFSQLLVTKKD